MKKILLTIAFVLMFGTIGTILYACNTSPKTYSFANTKELYAFSVVSGMELALSNESNNQLKQTESEFNQVVDYVHSYLPTVEGFLGNTTIIAPQEQTSDKTEYSKMLVVNYKDMLNKEHNYKLYYNESVPSENNRPSKGDDDYEVATKLSGEVLYNSTTYALEGVKEVERDEIEIKFTITLENNKKVVIEQETENNEQEFSYTIYNGNTEIYSTSFGVEVENGMIEFESEYEKDGKELELEIKQAEKNNNNKFYIEYEDNNQKTRIIVEKTIENNTVKYVYSNNDYTVTKIA